MSSVPAYSAPPRRADVAAAGAPVSFSSFSRPSRTDGGAGGGGFGSRSNGFDETAAAAFGKKPARTFEESPPVAAPIKVKPAKNTLASLIEDLLPPEPEAKEREWSRSALQQQRKAAAAEKAAQPAPKKPFEEEFPALGGAGGAAPAVRIPKPVFATAAVAGETKTTSSFASLAAGWAKSEEERKAAAEYAARLRHEQQQRDEYEHSQRTHLYFNRNANRHQGYENDEYNEYDDECAEGELGEDEYTEKDRRADRRAVANHYSDEEEEVDEDRADYNIGGNTAW
jgi:hypothetical protein